MRSDFFLSPTLICNPPVIAAVFKPLSSGFGKISKKQTVVMKTTVDWLREKDLNQRPSGYEPDELPNCSIPRYILLFSACSLYHFRAVLSSGISNFAHSAQIGAENNGLFMRGDVAFLRNFPLFAQKCSFSGEKIFKTSFHFGALMLQ